MGKTGKYSHKLMGKEVGEAKVYAEPHDMAGQKYDFGDVKGAGYPETGVKTTGIKIRGTGAAKKGVMARGPMG
jgi:hypothetical protein